MLDATGLTYLPVILEIPIHATIYSVLCAAPGLKPLRRKRFRFEFRSIDFYEPFVFTAENCPTREKNNSENSADTIRPSAARQFAAGGASLTAGSVFCRVGVCRGTWVCCRSWIVLERGKDSRAARSRSRRTQRTTRARPVAATFHRRTPRPAVQPSSACRIANCGVRFLPGWYLPQFLGFLQIPDRTGEVRTAAPPDPCTARDRDSRHLP